jgi:hypothetical protein
MVEPVIVAPEIVARLKAEKVISSIVSPAFKAVSDAMVAPSVAV